MKTVAAAMGAEIEDDRRTGEPDPKHDFNPAATAQLPFGLGYGTME